MKKKCGDCSAISSSSLLLSWISQGWRNGDSVACGYLYFCYTVGWIRGSSKLSLGRTLFTARPYNYYCFAIWNIFWFSKNWRLYHSPKETSLFFHFFSNSVLFFMELRWSETPVSVYQAVHIYQTWEFFLELLGSQQTPDKVIAVLHPLPPLFMQGSWKWELYKPSPPHL